MYKIGYIGNFKTVPQVVEHIINNDIDNLEKEYNNGWDINQKIVLSELYRYYSYKDCYSM